MSEYISKLITSDYISRQEVLKLLVNSIGKSNTHIQTEIMKMQAGDCIPRSIVLGLIKDVKNADGFKDYRHYAYLFDQISNIDKENKND